MHAFNVLDTPHPPHLHTRTHIPHTRTYLRIAQQSQIILRRHATHATHCVWGSGGGGGGQGGGGGVRAWLPVSTEREKSEGGEGLRGPGRREGGGGEARERERRERGMNCLCASWCSYRCS